MLQNNNKTRKFSHDYSEKIIKERPPELQVQNCHDLYCIRYSHLLAYYEYEKSWGNNYFCVNT